MDISLNLPSELEAELSTEATESDTPGKAGGLMSVTASKAGVLAGDFSISL